MSSFESLIAERSRRIQEDAPFLFRPTDDWQILRTYPAHTVVRLGTRHAVVTESDSGLVILPTWALRERIRLTESTLSVAALVDADDTGESGQMVEAAALRAVKGAAPDDLRAWLTPADIQPENPRMFEHVSSVPSEMRPALLPALRVAVRAQLAERVRLYREARPAALPSAAAEARSAGLRALSACVRTGRRAVEATADPLYLATYHRSLAEAHPLHALFAGACKSP